MRTLVRLPHGGRLLHVEVGGLVDEVEWLVARVERGRQVVLLWYHVALLKLGRFKLQSITRFHLFPDDQRWTVFLLGRSKLDLHRRLGARSLLRRCVPLLHR